MNDDLVYIDAMLVRTMGNQALAVILFKKFFSELPEQLKEIEIAIDTQEKGVAQEKIHKLQGGFNFCGFLELQGLAENLEKKLWENELDPVKESLKLLSEKVRQFYSLETIILKRLESK
ncbi:MAG: Hpt domain-containing protein [Methylococcales bacterium]|nr:Hpt domain-containing protein [Methylococcales bacterium]